VQERAVDGLKALLKLTLSTQDLAETQAGKRVRALTKHSDAQLAAAAGEVVAAWKDLVRRESAVGSGSQQQAASAGGAAAAGLISSASQPELASQPEVAPGGSPQPPRPDSQATQGTQGASAGGAAAPPDLPSTGDPVRDKCRANLAAALAQAAAEGAEGGDPSSLGVAVELALHTAHGGVTPAYKAKFRQLHFNLKHDKNPDLRRKVLEGGIAPEELITLSPEDLASDAKREDNQRIRERKLFDAAPAASKQATTDQFQCGKCRQRQCTYYQMQTRSADEPMTTFVSCLNCNNRWKFC
jgi:transcription elongation factor S-II